MTTTNITNGTSTHNVDTTNMDYGDYSINATFTDENTYNTAQSISLLTVKNPYATIIANTKSTDEWILVDDNRKLKNSKPTITSSGVQSGTYQHLVWNMPLKMNSTTQITCNTTSIQRNVFFGLTNNNTDWDWSIFMEKDTSNTKLSLWNGQNNNREYHNVADPTTTYTITVTILPTTITITYNNNTYTIDNIITSSNNQDAFYISVRKWGSGYITIQNIEYTPPQATQN